MNRLALVQCSERAVLDNDEADLSAFRVSSEEFEMNSAEAVRFGGTIGLSGKLLDDVALVFLEGPRLTGVATDIAADPLYLPFVNARQVNVYIGPDFEIIPIRR
jgi:hypothetical protein